MRIVMKGTVQGVGFRPAVYRTAAALGLRGTVCNDGSRVTIDIDDGERFLERFLKELPPLARIDSIEKTDSELPDSVRGFSIIGSEAGTRDGFSIPTDTAICDRCVNDILSGKYREQQGDADTFTVPGNGGAVI